MNTIKCGIIGCGVIAPSHIESYQNLPGAEVSAVCDLVEKKAMSMAERYRIATTCTDYRKMLDNPEIEAVSVCTDHASHARIVVDALNAGKHVICEKALGISPRDLDAMAAAHRQHPELVFAGVFQHRFEKLNRYVKGLIDRGAFGTLSAMTLNSWLLRTNDYYRQDAWRGTWADEGGSLLINQAIHYIDLLNWFSGGVEALCAKCENLAHQGIIETEDAAAVTLKFRHGHVGVICATSSSVEEWRHVITISGSKGHLEMCNDEISYFKFQDKAMHDEVANHLQQCREEKLIESNKDYYGQGHPAQIKDFIDAIREKRQPYVSAELARQTVDIVLACYESSRTGKWVKLP